MKCNYFHSCEQKVTETLHISLCCNFLYIQFQFCDSAVLVLRSGSGKCPDVLLKISTATRSQILEHHLEHLESARQSSHLALAYSMLDLSRSTAETQYADILFSIF